MAKQKPSGQGGQGAQINQMMRQMQQMQEDMAAAQSALADETVEVSAGGGMVKAVATGTGELRSVTIAPDVVDPDDIEMLQDLVTAAVNDGLNRVKELTQEKMGAVTGGIQIPGIV